MTDARETHLRQHITAYAGCAQYMAATAYRSGHRETGGPAYTLFSHAGRPILMLVGPGGHQTCNEAAHFAMDTDYVTALNATLLAKFGIQYGGDWHWHHSLGINHPSPGDVSHIHRLAKAHRIPRMVQLILTYEDATPMDRDADGPREAQESWPVYVTPAPRCRQHPKTVTPMAGGRGPLIRINAFLYPDAAEGPYLRCPLQIIPGPNPIRTVLADSGILDIPGQPSAEDFPLARIVYDEVEPPVAVDRPEQRVPERLAEELAELPEDVARAAKIRADRDLVLVVLPLSRGYRLCVVYANDQSSAGIRSVGIVRPREQDPRDVTEDVLAGDDDAPLKLVYLRAERRMGGGTVRACLRVFQHLVSGPPSRDEAS